MDAVLAPAEIVVDVGRPVPPEHSAERLDVRGRVEMSADVRGTLDQFHREVEAWCVVGAGNTLRCPVGRDPKSAEGLDRPDRHPRGELRSEVEHSSLCGQRQAGQQLLGADAGGSLGDRACRGISRPEGGRRVGRGQRVLPAANCLPEDRPILVRLFQQGGAAEHAVPARCLGCGNCFCAADYLGEVLLRDDYHTVGVSHDPVSVSYLFVADSQRHADLARPGRACALRRRTAREDGQLEGRQPLQVSHVAVDDDGGQADPHGLGSGELSEVGPLAAALGDEDMPGGRLLERGEDGGDGSRRAACGDGWAGDGPCTVQPSDRARKRAPLSTGVGGSGARQPRQAVTDRREIVHSFARCRSSHRFALFQTIRRRAAAGPVTLALYDAVAAASGA